MKKIISRINSWYSDQDHRHLVAILKYYALGSILFSSGCRLLFVSHGLVEVILLLFVSMVISLHCYNFTRWHDQNAEIWCRITVSSINFVCAAILLSYIGVEIPHGFSLKNALFWGMILGITTFILVSVVNVLFGKISTFRTFKK